MWRIRGSVVCTTVVASCVQIGLPDTPDSTNGGMSEAPVAAVDDLVDPEIALWVEHWSGTLQLAREYADRQGAEDVASGLDLLDELDVWVSVDLDNERLTVLQGAPPWVDAAVVDLNAGAEFGDSRLFELLPAAQVIRVIESGFVTEAEIDQELALRSFLSCAPMWCPSGEYTSLSQAQTALRGAGYHQVPGWAGGNDYDYAKPTSLCRRYERVICQNHCASAGCANPAAGRFRTFEEGPEPDPEIFRCRIAGAVPFGFVSWAAYVWAYHQLC
jgi:hypothetical protein